MYYSEAWIKLWGNILTTVINVQGMTMSFNLHANDVLNTEVVQRGDVGVLSLVVLQDYLLEDPV